jgi:hypothetical protein
VRPESETSKHAEWKCGRVEGETASTRSLETEPEAGEAMRGDTSERGLDRTNGKEDGVNGKKGKWKARGKGVENGHGHVADRYKT